LLWVETQFFLCFPEGGLLEAFVVLNSAARERNLILMMISQLSAVDQDQVRFYSLRIDRMSTAALRQVS